MRRSLGRLECYQDNFERALQLISEGLQVADLVGDTRLIARNNIFLGEVYEGMGDYNRAYDLYSNAFITLNEVGDQCRASYALVHLGKLCLLRDELEDARQKLIDSLLIGRGFKYLHCIVIGLEAFAALGLVRRELTSDLHHMVTLYAAAAALHEQTSIVSAPGRQRVIDKEIAELKQIMSAEDFQRLWSEGSHMTWEQAIEYAISAYSDISFT